MIYIPISESIDGSALLATASSIARRGSLDINVIAYSDWLLPPIAGMGVLGDDGNVYSKKGVTPSLLMAPLVMVADALPALTTQATAMLFNPLVTTLTAILLFILAKAIGIKGGAAWLMALLYGCGTMALVYAGTLFGEPVAALLLTATVLFYARWRTAHGTRALAWVGGMGACLGLLIGINLVYGALIPLAGGFLMAHTLMGRAADASATIRQRPFPQRAGESVLTGIVFALPIALVLVGIGALNLARFGDPFTSGYRFAEGEGFIHPLLTGLFGLLLSPYRGVFWYNPLLLVALPGVWLLLRQRSTRSVMGFALALAAGVALLFASWWSWHGGIVWGPRFMIPVLPMLILPLAPVIERLSDPAWHTRLRVILIGGFAAVVLLSLGVQISGALISYVPYYAELKAAHFTGDMTAIVTELDDTVLTDPALSPIMGHARLLLTGTPPQVAWLAQGVDGVILLAALTLMGLGVALSSLPGTLLPRRSWHGGALLIAIVAAGVVAGRGGAPTHDRIDRLATTVAGADSVVVASTSYGAALIDLETRARVVSINSPVSVQDTRAQQLWAYARLGSAHFAYLTWMPPAEPLDWMGRDLYESAAFLREQPLDGHRLLRFETSAATSLMGAGGWQFGDVRLNRWGAQLRHGLLEVALAWQISTPNPTSASWFVHVLDADGQIIAQQDRAPLGGYAPHSVEQAGAMWQDRLAFAIDPLPSGASLRIGWVDSGTGERLPVTSAEGTPVPDGFILLPLDFLAPHPP